VTLPADGTYVLAVKNAYQTGTLAYTFNLVRGHEHDPPDGGGQRQRQSGQPGS